MPNNEKPFTIEDLNQMYDNAIKGIYGDKPQANAMLNDFLTKMKAQNGQPQEPTVTQ